MSSKKTKREPGGQGTPRTEKPGVYVYVGPTVRGVIQEGTIYAGKKAEVLARVGAAIDAFPRVADLIVPAGTVAAVRHQIKNGTNLYSIAYREMLKN